MKISSRNVLRKRITQRLRRQDVWESQSIGIMLLYMDFIILSLRPKILETKYELRSALFTLLIYNITTLSWAGHGLIKLILIYNGRTISGFTVNRRLLSQRKSSQRSSRKGSRKTLRYIFFTVILRKYRENHTMRIILLFILLK